MIEPIAMCVNFDRKESENGWQVPNENICGG